MEEIREKILEGKAQADRGEVIDGPTAMKKLEEKYGLSKCSHTPE
jgi:hypothetical protein